MILTFGMGHLRLKVYDVYINDDPMLTLTYFTARSKLRIVHIPGPESGKPVQNYWSSVVFELGNSGYST